MKKYFGLFVAAAMFTSCENTVDLSEIDGPSAATSGSADFSKYVSIGNSLTAGYADGGVYAEAQALSFPSTIAGQLAEAGGTATFSQPMVTGNGSGYIKLTGFDALGSPILTPQDPSATFGQKVTGDFNNLGIPGIRVYDVVNPSYGTLNPYMHRILPEGSEETTPYYALAAAAQATFFTCWLGNNDVLGYATSGGEFPVTGNPNIPFGYVNGITPVEDIESPIGTLPGFKTAYDAAITAITANGAKGVVATIPNVTAIPYFTTVNFILADQGAFNPVTLTAQEAGGANLVYQAYGYNSPGFSEGATNTLVIETEPGVVRFFNPKTDLLLLPFLPEAGKLLTGLGSVSYLEDGTPVATPIPDKYVLDLEEITNVLTATAQYNAHIQSVAAGNDNIGLWDANAFFNSFVQSYLEGNPYSQHGVSADPRFIQGGAFSLDGVHATPRGYAIIANEFINAINTTFGASVPHVSIGEYRGVKFP